MNSEQANAVRANIVRTVTLICDNDQKLWSRLTAVAADAVREGMGTGVTLEQYALTYHSKPGGAYERWEYAQVVGNAVCNELEEIVTEHDESFIRTLLIDLLDLNDSSLREMFGEHYLPDPRDLSE